MFTQNKSSLKPKFFDQDVVSELTGISGKNTCTVFWSKEESIIIQQLEDSIEKKADLIITDILPDELPKITTSNEYSFFIDHFRFIPPFCDKLNHSKEQHLGEKIIIISDPLDCELKELDKALSIISNKSQINENLMVLDSNQMDIKSVLDGMIPYTKKIVLNTLDPNIIHYAAIISHTHNMSISIVSPYNGVCGRSLLFGFRIKNSLSTEGTSLRHTINKVILGDNSNIETNSDNIGECLLRLYAFEAGNDDEHLAEILRISEVSSKYFTVNQKYPYSFNPIVRNNLKFKNNFFNLNRIQLNFILNYFDYLQNIPEKTGFQKNDLIILVGKLFKSWISSNESDFMKKFMVNFLCENFEYSNHLIEIASQVTDSKIKVSFFGKLSECFFRAHIVNKSISKNQYDFRQNAIQCLEIQKQINPHNQYSYCLDVCLEKENSEIQSDEIKKYIFKSGKNYINSLNLMSSLPFQCSYEVMHSLPFESMSRAHFMFLFDAILWEQGYSILEIIWYDSFTVEDLSHDARRLILHMENNIDDPPWKLLLLSKIIQPGRLNGHAHELPLRNKIILKYCFEKYKVIEKSTDLLVDITSEQVDSPIDALLLLTLFDQKDSKLTADLNKKFDIKALLENDEHHFDPFLYPLVYRLSQTLDHSSMCYYKRLSDSLSPLYNANF